jgi:beta-glucosidase
VAQLYLGFPSGSGEPPLQLKGIHKTRVLQPGESVEVSFDLGERDLSTWSVTVHGWVRAAGDFEVFVGASSCDLRMRGSISV